VTIKAIAAITNSKRSEWLAVRDASDGWAGMLTPLFYYFRTSANMPHQATADDQSSNETG
jgi:hypothetical protein